MTFENFTAGNHFTIGLELELRILDSISLRAKNQFEYIKENIDKQFSQNLAKEFLDSMIEINTPVFKEEQDLIKYLKKIITQMKEVASKKDLCLQTSGSYAQNNSEFKINKNKRYMEIYEEHKALLDNFSICGTHVHIGFENFQKALKAYNYSIFYLPLFVALNASSSFHNGINTGIHSFRTKIFERLPKASIPEYYDNYEQMKKIYDFLYKSKVINSTKDIWWDVRIQPHFKTLEFRVCDAVNDFDRLEVTIALFKALCQLSQNEKIVKMPMQVLKQNMWSATRYSMDGRIVTKNAQLISIRDMLNQLAQKAYKKSYLSETMFHKCKQIIAKDSLAKEMISVYEKSKSLKEVEKIGVF